MPEIQLGSKLIKEDSTPYIIAEIGVNHEGSMETAKELIYLAKSGGANAAKFQSYKADTIASVNSPAYWDRSKEKTSSQHELFKKYDKFNEADFIELSEYCQKLGIDFLSTPFDNNAVNFLNNLMPFYKVASADITNIPLLQLVASKNKPVILSTGASYLNEIDTSIDLLNKYGVEQISLLHCILNYPTDNKNANLDMILGLKEIYPDLIIGYSDHTVPDPKMLVLTTAYLKGAVIIEKHFTYDKSLPGNDHYHAMDVDDLKAFCKNIEFIQKIKGSRDKAPLPSEEISRKNARRSLVSRGNIKKGTILTADLIICKRPGTGIPSEQLDLLIGKVSQIDIPDDEILKWDMFVADVEN